MKIVNLLGYQSAWRLVNAQEVLQSQERFPICNFPIFAAILVFAEFSQPLVDLGREGWLKS